MAFEKNLRMSFFEIKLNYCYTENYIIFIAIWKFLLKLMISLMSVKL